MRGSVSVHVSLCGSVGERGSYLGLEGVWVALQRQEHSVVAYRLVRCIVAAVGAVATGIAVGARGKALAVTGGEGGGEQRRESEGNDRGAGGVRGREGEMTGVQRQ